ncbi:trehalose-6-phosphate hydrolase [Fictibacillus enclensis]|uniref:Alpha,alpha-phosphotrehalase n=1 Tax=Fictibacillus enclensis TaxID=1017270 RepID=A0A0V8J7W4_9BACL|nr:alpha,alpha-phosphotrehalase [Fictibacillus enclensis]KSU83282.1 glucohydrolase [Fictibacillus enclensis]SCC12947.1 trehalose-6-phosphate hydrolase [Fictibacillus enclensis]
MEQPWWKKSVVYQIYPKSFKDTTGSGTGDLNGIIEKLDYLKVLGIDVIWLTPIYESPQKDNGYDISDYYKIHEEYGSMEDFERLLSEAHQRDINIIMDIVVNHTSTEHAWFKQARSSKDNEFRDFYIWKDKPNNWKSKFGGSAWKYDEVTNQHYLHLFDVTQADLNWENEKVREKVYEMMNFWFDKGVDGFRLDVINLISKNQDFPDDDGTVKPGDGRRFYTDGPRAHEFLKEMNREIFSKHESLTVGEMSSTSIDHCIQYSNPESKELSMTFNFHHLKVDYPDGEKWTVADFDFVALKRILSEWQIRMHEGGGWNALFWCNHDQPRIVSRYGNNREYREQSAKMLATVIHCMQGTPYIYQGEELGMTNPGFERINKYRDVESLNIYKELTHAGMNEEEVLAILNQKSRDNSRTPVQWDSTENAGFTTGTPWIDVAQNYKDINAEKAIQDKNSVFSHYQKLISMRKTMNIFTDGDYQWIDEEHPAIFAYTRNAENESLMVVNNFYGTDAEWILPEEIEFAPHKATVLLSNYEDSPTLAKTVLRPYESIVYHIKK